MCPSVGEWMRKEGVCVCVCEKGGRERGGTIIQS